MARLRRIADYLPTVTLWNRLEGRPRTVNFDRALKAEVADALWMISKQWQMGEFIGDDAGSPVLAKALLETTRLSKYQAGDEPATAMELEVPLEVTVENRPIVFERAGQRISLDIRLLMGRQWLKLVGPVDPALKDELHREVRDRSAGSHVAQPTRTSAPTAVCGSSSWRWPSGAWTATSCMRI